MQAELAAHAEDSATPDAALVPAPRAPVIAAVLLALAALGLGSLVLTVAGRAAFAFPLEWMEGASLHHALRLLEQRPLYAAPSADFVAYLYPPLAYLPMAASVALLGPSLFAARLPSLLCSLLALVLIGRAAARASGHALAGFVAAGAFAIGFGYTGAFLDLARVDACFVLLLVAAAERVLAERPRSALCLLVLCAFTKQHGLLLLAALSVALLARDGRRTAASVALAWAALLAIFCVLELTSGGWFSRYALELPASHALVPRLFFGFFAVDLLVYLPVLSLAAGLEVARRVRLAGVTHFDVLLLAGMIAGALGRAHPGGHDNVRLPAFALLCIAGAAPLCRLALGARKPALRAGLCAALALQFAVLFQAPSFHAPPPRSARQFADLHAALTRCARGGVAVSLDYALLGASPFVHTMALSDLRMGSSIALGRAGSSALLARLASNDAPAAIAVGEAFPALERALARHYRVCAELPAPSLATGHRPGARAPSGPVQRVYARVRR